MMERCRLKLEYLLHIVIVIFTASTKSLFESGALRCNLLPGHLMSWLGLALARFVEAAILRQRLTISSTSKVQFYQRHHRDRLLAQKPER